MNWHLNWVWLPDEMFHETINSKDAKDRIVGAFIYPHRREIRFLRGDLISEVMVPFDWFEPCGDGIKPDFDKLALDDWGQTVALGEYEVSERSIIRDFDSEYNRKCLEGATPEARREMLALAEKRDNP